jgi:hypothetical protein
LINYTFTLLEELNKQKVEYLVVGGYAVNIMVSEEQQEILTFGYDLIMARISKKYYCHYLI